MIVPTVYVCVPTCQKKKRLAFCVRNCTTAVIDLYVLCRNFLTSLKDRLKVNRVRDIVI